MFSRKKKVHVRILDSPKSMMIEPTFIAVPLPDGKILILHGSFENIRDEDAYKLVQDKIDNLKAA